MVRYAQNGRNSAAPPHAPLAVRPAPQPRRPIQRAHPEKRPLAKPNFAFQKRQKELDKKRKAEDKLRAKQLRKEQAANPDAAAPEDGAEAGTAQGEDAGSEAADPAAPPAP